VIFKNGMYNGLMTTSFCLFEQNQLKPYFFAMSTFKVAKQLINFERSKSEAHTSAQ